MHIPVLYINLKKVTMKPLFIFLISLLLLFSGCTKKLSNQRTKTDCKDWTDATLENHTGLDCCTWGMRLADGQYLAPVNLGDFNITLVEGKKVAVHYIVRTDLAGCCMMGKIVEIKCLKEK